MKLKKIISAITAFAMTISLFTVANASSSNEKPAIAVTFDGYEKVSDTSIYAYIDFTIDITAAETLEAYSSKLNMTTWEEEIEGNGISTIGISWTMPVGFSYAAGKSSIPDGFEINTAGTILTFGPKPNPKEYLVKPITTVKLAYRVDDFDAAGDVIITNATIDGKNSTENSIWSYSYFKDTISLTHCSIPAYNDYSPTMSVEVVNVSDETFTTNTTFEVKISYSSVPVSENDYDWAGTALSYLQFSLPLPGYGQYYVANGQYYEIDTLGANSSRSAATNLVDSTYKYAWVGNSASASAYKIGADNILTLKFVVIKDFDKTINFSLEKDAMLGTITYNSHGKLSSTKDYQKSDNTLTTMSDYIMIKSNFEVDIYRAIYLINSQIGSIMEDNHIDITSTPCKKLYDAGQENGLDNAVAAWDAVMNSLDVVDNPASIADYAFEEKDMYEAIIMSLFESSVDYKIMGYINGEITKQSKNLFSQITSQMKNKYNFDLLDGTNLKNLTDKQRQEVADDMAEYFKNDYQNAAIVSKGVGFISDALKYANDFQSLCEKVSAYYNIMCLSDSMKQVMQDMYNECPADNLALKQALKDCINIMNSGDDEFTQKMLINLMGLTGKNVAQAGINEYWNSVKTTFSVAHPAAFAFQAAYSAGKYITEVCFNTDAIAEKYCNIVALMNVETLLDSIYTKTKNNFQLSSTQGNAKLYNSIVDVMFNMKDTDCKYALAYVDAIDSSLAGKLAVAFGDSSVEESKKKIKSIQSSSSQVYVQVLTGWITALENEYPDKFYEYEHYLYDAYENYNKRYNINCPVDVYVFDKNGAIVGSVVNNVPYCRDDANITISVIGDRKTIYMYGEEYDIVYKGNDTGTMDITVTEYDETTSAARNVYFNNLELTKGLTYTSSETGTNSSENVYTLSNEAAESIAPDFDSVTDAESETYAIQISRGYFTDTMAVSQELHKGENVEITAYIPEGYEFVEWTSDANEDIFDDENSSTTKITIPDYDVNIAAKLIECPTLSISSITDSSVTVKAINCSDITDGTIILAIYDANGILEHLKAKDFTEEISFTDLELENGIVKVMLWDNLIPLTKSTQKLFYFETVASE